VGDVDLGAGNVEDSEVGAEIRVGDNTKNKP
jgi:hypothetical protein